MSLHAAERENPVSCSATAGMEPIEATDPTALSPSPTNSPDFEFSACSDDSPSPPTSDTTRDFPRPSLYDRIMSDPDVVANRDPGVDVWGPSGLSAAEKWALYDCCQAWRSKDPEDDAAENEASQAELQQF
ncbi:hypothetical protein ACJZ2D_005799 [Fusarium nematophilum]